MSKLSKRIAALQAAMRKRALSWTDEDDEQLAKAIRDGMAGREFDDTLRAIVKRRAEEEVVAFQMLIDLAEASVEGPPDGYVPPDEPEPSKPSKPDVSLPIIEPIADLLDKPPIATPPQDVKEYFDDLERG